MTLVEDKTKRNENIWNDITFAALPLLGGLMNRGGSGMGELGPGATQSLLTGLAGSLADNFKQESDRRRDEDAKRQNMDYEILMRALETMKPDLTPSQVSEIMTRAVDIFKPKGAGKVKDQLKMIFGGGAGPYEMQGESVLQDVLSRPRKQTGTSMENEATPSVFTDPYGKTTVLPGPPMPETAKPEYEQTFRERGISDEERKFGYQLDKQRIANEQIMQRQAALEDRRQRGRLDLQSNNFAQQIRRMGVGAQLKAEAKFRERRGMIAAQIPNASDEQIDQATWDSLNEDVGLRQDLMREQIKASQQRQSESANRIRQADERIAIAEQRLKAVGSKTSLDPQVKAMQAQAKSFLSVATQMRKNYSTVMANFAAATTQADRDAALAQAQGFLNAAEENEKAAQGLADEIEARLDSMGAVPLRANRAGGSNRSGGKLTEAEIRARGGGDAEVQRARDRNLLAEP